MINLIRLLAILLFPFVTSAEDLTLLGETLFNLPIQHEDSEDFFDDFIPIVEANAPNQSSPNALIEYDGEPSAIVAGCVNIITGSYIEQKEDFVLGPLSFIRSYSSNAPLSEEPFSNWHHNHENFISISKSKRDHKPWEKARGFEYLGFWHGPCGLTLDFRGTGTSSNIHLEIEKDQRKGGLSNLGPVSGKYNINNLKMLYAKKSSYNHCFLKQGDGTLSSFARIPDRSKFLMVEQTKPSKNKLKYSYNKDHLLTSIKAYNNKDKATHGIKLEYLDNGHIYANLSDGRSWCYEYSKLNKKGKLLHRLDRVRGPGNSCEEFIYNDEKIVKHIKPEGRTLSISYHGNEHERLKGRVHTLHAPVGNDQQEHITHTFHYEPHKHTGKAHVTDCDGNKTAYEWNKNKQICGIFHYGNNEKLYRAEKTEWEDDHHHCGNILSKTIEDGSGYPILHKKYSYDHAGNVLQETICGNLTGHEVSLNNVNKGYLKIINLDNWYEKTDRYTKKYTYSNDGKNLLLSEQDNRKKITYTYLEGTNLIESRLTLEEGQIKLREFSHYNSNNELIEEIVDDGASKICTNLDGISERKIKRYTYSKSHPGLPKELSEYYLENGNEIFLKKVVNKYTKEGWLFSQDVYDSNEILCYTLFWEYNAGGKIIKEIDPENRVTIREYDLNENLISEELLNSKCRKTYLYDKANRLIKETLCDGEDEYNVCFTYNKKGQKTSSTDYSGHTTKFEYDAFGRLIKTIFPAISDEFGNDTILNIETEYNVLNQPIQMKDTNGKITRTDFTLRGQPYKITFPDGSIRYNRYSLDGLLTHTKDISGLSKSFIYDYQGRVIKETHYDRNGKSFDGFTRTYSGFRLIKEVNHSGIETLYKYDGAGRVIEIRKGSELIRKSYDALGRCSNILKYASDIDFIEEKYQYDKLNRVILEELLDSQGIIQRHCEYEYDIYGNKSKITTRTVTGDSITLQLYNALGKPIEIVNPNGAATKFEYPIKNNWKKEIHPDGTCTTQFEDALGRLQKIEIRDLTGKLLSKKENFYDCSGLLKSTEESVIVNGEIKNRKKIKYEYTPAGKLSSIIDGHGTPSQKIVKTLYNEYGEKSQVQKSDGTVISYDYDLCGRTVSIKSSDQTINYEYIYSKDGDLIESIDHIHNRSTKKFYDEEGKVSSELLGNEMLIQYEYDALGRPKKVIFPDQSNQEYEYSGSFISKVKRNNWEHAYHWELGQVNTMTLPQQCGEITYSYNLSGNLEKIEHQKWKQQNQFKNDLLKESIINDPIGSISGKYEYDQLKQLISEDGVESHQYQNDSLLNHISFDLSPNEIGGLNQAFFCNGYEYTYDSNGNRIDGCGKQYRYDALDRLIKVEMDDYSIQYTYDDENRRLTAEHFHGEQSIKFERFIYVGQNECGVVEEGRIRQLRILGVGKGAEIGASIAIELDGETYHPIHDTNGNIVSLLTQNGEIHETYRYSAFGNEHIYNYSNEELQTSLNPWRFSSKRKDESGLIYFGRRYYDPATTTWTTPDPLGYEAGPNLYAYVSNNPLTNIDPYGLKENTNICNNLNLSNLCHNIYEGFSRVTTIVGQTIEAATWNLLPPFIRDPFMLIGHVIKTHTFQGFIPSWKEQHSENFCLAAQENCISIPIGYLNGVGNTYANCIAVAEYISQCYGGSEVSGSYNAGHGFVTDIGESVCQMFGIPTNSVREFVNLVRTMNKEWGQNVWKKIIVSSQGGLIANNAKKYLRPSEIAFIILETYGTAKIISSGYGAHINVISQNDPVPVIANLFDPNIRKLNPNWLKVFLNPFKWDHTFFKGYYNEILLNNR